MNTEQRTINNDPCYIKDESVDFVYLDPSFIRQVCPPSVSRNKCSG